MEISATQISSLTSALLPFLDLAFFGFFASLNETVGLALDFESRIALVKMARSRGSFVKLCGVFPSSFSVGNAPATWHVGWSGMRWDGMGWDGIGWDRMGWNGMERDGMGWNGMGCGGMG